MRPGVVVCVWRVVRQIARMPPDEPRDDPRDEPPNTLPPLAPFHTPGREERPLPRGCHPLVFGVIMATLQMAALWFFMPSCFGRPG